MAHELAYALDEYKAHYEALTIQQTWGHLAAQKNKSYQGTIVFAVSVFQSGSIQLVDYEFKNLESSPWLYDSVFDFLYSLNLPEGGVYKFDGVVKNYEFSGKIQTILTPLTP